MIITPMAVEQNSQGDFEVEISGSRLLVPQNVMRALNQLSVRTAEEFVTYLYTFPSGIASMLGWEVQDVVNARSNLVSKLHGLVAEDILVPRALPRRAYGARFPATPAFRRGFGRNDGTQS